jgi:undecaprenyl pyrophosphate synthase
MAATLAQAATKASKAGAKVAACERRLEKLRKDCERAEGEYMSLAAEAFANVRRPTEEVLASATA